MEVGETINAIVGDEIDSIFLSRDTHVQVLEPPQLVEPTWMEPPGLLGHCVFRDDRRVRY